MEYIQSNGVRLALWRWGNPERPTVLLVHGYPDNHHVWEPLAERLARNYHVVAYDVRGAGESSIPRRTRDYRLEYLIDDLAAVAAHASPREPVHLVGHDWGSIQCWEAVTEPRLQKHFASLTSISGPSLDHAGLNLRGATKGGGRLRQLARSWYIGFFHLPLLAPLGWRLGLGRRWPSILKRREGITLSGDDPEVRSRDGVHGIKLYRANILRRLLWPRERHTDIPVQIIVPTKDPFVGPNLTLGLEPWVPNLTRFEVDAGHWLPLSRPDKLAEHIDAFIAI